MAAHLEPRQAQKPPEGGIIVFRPPSQGERHALVLVTDRHERYVGIGHTAPVIGYKTNAEPETNEIHDPFASQPVTPNLRMPTEIAYAPNDIVVDFRPGFACAHDEGSRSDILPSKSVAMRERALLMNSKMDVFANEDETVSILWPRLPGGNHDVDRSVAKEGQEIVSVGLGEAEIDIRMPFDERGDNVAEQTLR